MKKQAGVVFKTAFLHPKYWPTLLLLGLMYLISWLPYFIQFEMGKGIGRLAMKYMKRRRRIVEKNLTLAFPELPEATRQEWIKKNIDNTGLALFETGMAWFWPDVRIEKHVRYEGLEILEAFEQQKKGVLLVGIHSMNLEIGGRALGLKYSGLGVYRPNDNPCFDYFQYKGRARSCSGMIGRRDVRGMLKALAEGERVWYAPDHDYGPRRSTFAPLFAVEKACTTMGPSLLADSSNCAIVPFTIVRESDDGQYVIKVWPALEDFPKKDPEAAAAYMNKTVEKMILAAPDQYMWLHRRFKTRPEGEESLY